MNNITRRFVKESFDEATTELDTDHELVITQICEDLTADHTELCQLLDQASAVKYVVSEFPPEKVISISEERFLTAFVNMMTAGMGVTVEQLKVFKGSPEGKTLSLEAIQGGVWETIKRVIKAIIDKIVAFWNWITGSSKKVEAKQAAVKASLETEAVKKKAEEMTEAFMKEAVKHAQTTTDYVHGHSGSNKGAIEGEFKVVKEDFSDLLGVSGESFLSKVGIGGSIDEKITFKKKQLDGAKAELARLEKDLRKGDIPKGYTYMTAWLHANYLKEARNDIEHFKKQLVDLEAAKKKMGKTKTSKEDFEYTTTHEVAVHRIHGARLAQFTDKVPSGGVVFVEDVISSVHNSLNSARGIFQAMRELADSKESAKNATTDEERITFISQVMHKVVSHIPFKDENGRKEIHVIGMTYLVYDEKDFKFRLDEKDHGIEHGKSYVIGIRSPAEVRRSYSDYVSEYRDTLVAETGTMKQIADAMRNQMKFLDDDIEEKSKMLEDRKASEIQRQSFTIIVHAVATLLASLTRISVATASLESAILSWVPTAHA